MADPNGPVGPVRDEAAKLLRAEGVEPPTRTRGGGKGRRMVFRAPVNGIPGAPLRDREDRREQMAETPRLRELQLEYAILSLRVWLAGLTGNDPRPRSAYLAWQAGSVWMAPSAFDKEARGGFSALKRRAAAENARVRRTGGDPLADATTRANAVITELAELYAAGTVRQPEPVPFGEVLRAVMDGPHAEVEMRERSVRS